MLRVFESTVTLPFHRPAPLTPLPLIYHREHHFPYPSYGETNDVAEPRAFRMIVLENDFVRVEVAPELGGRVYGFFDKRIGREILFRNPVVKPVRILPVWGFISGGIEFNFPIAHSPTSIEPVGCVTGQRDRYAYVRVGEREARTGMEWVVELGLSESSPALVQRTSLRNQTGASHPWMLWTIAAVPSTPHTEFVHPPHRVLIHDERIRELDWPGADLNWDRTHSQMTALFWKPGSAPAFGAFQHGLECGLLHLADPTSLPGKKVWTYGHGHHRAWAHATTTGGLAYAEIESGPLFDQSEKPDFPHGAERRFEEYWVPVHRREDFEHRVWSPLDLPPLTEPWLGWQHSPWQSAWERFRAGDGPLPESTVPTGLPLESALRQAFGRGDAAAAQPLALWLAFHQRPAEALRVVETDHSPAGRRLTGLVLWRGLRRAAEAIPHLEAGPLADPIATVELDTLCAELGMHARRVPLLQRAPMHRLITERQADLALALGRPEETLRLLDSREWPREHQRYVRTQLWRQARAQLGQDTSAPPDSLGEDNLAAFGSYWSD